MQERLMEILVKLLKEIHRSEDMSVVLKDLSEHLRLQGYSESELDSALSWLTSQIEKEDENAQGISASKGSIRVLHPIERMMLKSEAYGYLLHLAHLGLIHTDQIEMIIERALSSGKSEITVQDMKMVIASLFSEPEQADWMSISALGFDDESSLKIH